MTHRAGYYSVKMFLREKCLFWEITLNNPFFLTLYENCILFLISKFLPQWEFHCESQSVTFSVFISNNRILNPNSGKISKCQTFTVFVCSNCEFCPEISRFTLSCSKKRLFNTNCVYYIEPKIWVRYWKWMITVRLL